MSRLVNLSDPVYAELTRIKRAKGQSYSEVVESLLARGGGQKATDNWDRLIALMKDRDSHFHGKREKTDHDLIVYGASRARS